MKAIGIIIHIDREAAAELFHTDQDVLDSTATISSLPDKPLHGKFYDHQAEKLYLHFTQPVSEECLSDYFYSNEIIYELT